MAKITLKGFIANVGEIEEVGANKTFKQSVILKVPGYVDQFGEKKGNDEYWDMVLLGADKIDRFNIQNRHKGAKVSCDVYINSNWYENKATGKTGCIVNVNLAKIDFLDGSNLPKNEPAKSTRQPVDFSADPIDDDLPF